jgi:hypothetical protein
VADIASWFKAEWFSLVQTAGVVGGLIFTGVTISRDAKAKEAANLLAFAERHRLLWSELLERPELQRIFSETADLSESPITQAEEVFLNLAFVQYEAGWRMAKNVDRNDLKPLKADVRKFFTLPLQRVVWDKTKGSRNPKFVRFVEKALF